MITLESNLTGVIGRLKRMKDHDIPTAMAKALTPARWLEPFRREAEQALLVVAEPSERDFIPKFIATVTAAVLQGGFAMRMRAPFGDETSLQDFQAAAAAGSVADMGQNLFLSKVEEFRDIVQQWVEREKVKDKRDTGKSDEDIAHFISYLMLTPDERLTPAEQAAAISLAPHIVEFVQKNQAESRLTAEKTTLWLKAVLVAWREFFKAEFPVVFHQEFKATGSTLPF